MKNITGTSSHTQRIWVCDDDCVFCHHGVPYAFGHDELDVSDVIHQVGMVHIKHFDDNNTQVLAVNHSLIKDKLAHPIPNGEFIAYRQVVGQLSEQTACELSAGIQLLLWQKSNQFCGCCGNKTHYHDKDTAMICSSCHQHFYPKIQPCIIIAITRSCPSTNQTQILLAQHHRHSQTGMYGVIAGYMEVGESVEMTIHREVAEEVGLSVNNIRYIKSQAWPYPTNLMLGFVANYQSGEIDIEAEELSDAQFFDKDHLPPIPPKGTIAHELICQVLNL